MIEELENLTCPLCSSNMKSRKGPYGIFWGCSKYPECKGKRNSEGEAPRGSDNDNPADEPERVSFSRRYE